MRRKSSWSSALWWVVNGLASAPPGIGWKIGVSTSMKSRSSSHRRQRETIFDRASRAARASGVTQVST